MSVRRLALLMGVAFALRAGLAVVTEKRSIFPAYYYTDARLMDEYAWDLAEAWRTGNTPALRGSATQVAQSALLACVYRLFGRKPLAGKIVTAALGAASLLLLFVLFRPGFGAQRALLACWLAALWPSHVFFTSQNFKEALVMVLAYGALAGLTLAGGLRPRAGKLALAAGFACALLLGFLRTYMAVLLTGAVSAALVWSLLRREGEPRARPMLWAALTLALAAPVVFRPLARLALGAQLAASSSLAVVPEASGGPEPVTRPLTPHGIAEFRRIHQMHDLKWARGQLGREIGSQLFYEQRLESWRDVLVFLPKGVFYALFMPLPGLYPMAGKIGRMAAAAENILLLLLAGLALLGLRKAPRRDLPLRAALLLFAVMAAGSGLLEFDLGSATRHRTVYLPLIFPLAAAAALRSKNL